MTGPTSVARNCGSPTTSSSIAPHSMRRISSAVFSRQAQQAQRRAALARAVERRCSASRTTCSGSAELSTIIALTPPVSAISVASAPVARRERRVDRARRLDGARERDARDARVAEQRLADRAAVAGQELQRAGRDAGLLEQRDGARRNERALLGRLRDDGVAGRERRGDLPREDREREVPRAHADEHAAADQLELVALAGRARQPRRASRARARTRRRSSARDRRPREPRRGCRARSCPVSATQRATSSARSASTSVGRALAAAPRARAAGVSFQLRRERARRVERAARRAGVGELGDADDAAPVGGIAAFVRGALHVLAVDARPRAPAAGFGRARAPRRAPRARGVDARFVPREFSRSGANRSRGNGMRGCRAAAPKPRATSTGSATISSTLASACTSRFTNEVFAPFSSSRRTRYGSRCSWLPTGA